MRQLFGGSYLLFGISMKLLSRFLKDKVAYVENSLSNEIYNILRALSFPALCISPLTFCSLCSFSRKDLAILFA